MIVLLLLALTNASAPSSETGRPADAIVSVGSDDPAELVPEQPQRRRRVVQDKEKSRPVERVTPRVRQLPQGPDATRRDSPGFFTHAVSAEVGDEWVHARVLSSVPLALPAWMLAFAALPILPLTMNVGALLGLIFYVAEVQNGSSEPLALLVPIVGLIGGATWPFALAGLFHAYLASETAARASAKLEQRMRERGRSSLSF